MTIRQRLNARYASQPPPERLGKVSHYPVAIAGAGPVGMAAARDLALHGVRAIVLDDDDKVSVGSRAICWAKRTLEIFDRLGCAAPMVCKGVTWNVGKVFFRDAPDPLYSFDLQPQKDQGFPAFINLQQYYVEEILVDLLERTPLTDIRWQSRVIAVRQHPKYVEISIDTPQGPYSITADYLIAADGSRSTVRSMLGLEFVGEAFRDHFLIADVRMQADRPAERWFWFDPPFAPGQSALLHKQPDGIWRLDFQLGWNIDREAELDIERVTQRVRSMLGSDTAFELEWASIYTFQCRRLERFVHDRVIFAGDAAHLVSPFGARGANGGVQDIDNLCWKLALVLQDVAPARLLESYDAERVHAARENLLNSTRSTDFITPKTAMSRAFRDAVLELARNHEFARSMVNSGRLSLPAVLSDSPLNPPGSHATQSRVVPGVPAVDAPVTNGAARSWFLRELSPQHFTLVIFGVDNEATAARLDLPVPLKVLHVCPPDAAATRPDQLIDIDGRLAQIADATSGTCLLYRPDQHLAARWNDFNSKRLRAALAHCIGRSR